jgi:hypothetical protein
MEKFDNYLVIVGVEKTENGGELPLVETQTLEILDRVDNYEWADEDKTILKKRGLEL